MDLTQSQFKVSLVTKTLLVFLTMQQSSRKLRLDMQDVPVAKATGSSAPTSRASPQPTASSHQHEHTPAPPPSNPQQTNQFPPASAFTNTHNIASLPAVTGLFSDCTITGGMISVNLRQNNCITLLLSSLFVRIHDEIVHVFTWLFCCYLSPINLVLLLQIVVSFLPNYL